MSKAIAQTVGGKRFAWLLALLAVFAVLASSQLNTGSASAAGTGDGSLSAPADDQGVPQLAPGPQDNEPNYLYPGLYHVGPTGELLTAYLDDPQADTDGYIAAPRDIENNLIGFEHIICLVPLDVPWEGDTNVEIGDDLQPDGGDGGIVGIVESEDDYNWYIQNLLGSANIVSAQKIDLNFGDYVNGDDLPCIRWFSSGPGEQNVTVVDEQGTTAADMADGGDQDYASTGDVCPDENPENDECDNQDISPTNGTDSNGLTGPAVPLVKEWNLLDRTTITRPGSTVDIQNTEVVVPAFFNPATSRYRALSNTAFNENVFGVHTTSGGAVLNPIVAGAQVTFTASGVCGYTIVDGTLNDSPPPIFVNTGTTLEGADTTGDASGRIIYPGESVTVTSIGVPIYFEVGTEDCTVLSDMWHRVTISVDYPTNIGSQNPPVPADEVITVRWVSQLASKKVMLAWAGQRILLEHDWRIPPGGIDEGIGDDEPIPGGGTADTDLLRCPWTFAGLPVVFVSKFLKQAGDGTFLSNNELGPLTAIGDLLLDLISPDEVNNITFADSCVSRAVYESNPPGQVDITLQVTDVCFDIDIDGGQAPVNQSSIPAAFDCFLEPVDPLNQSKVDFVIYYMKFEDVRLSLVTSVSKPTHNSSLSGWSDYAPGNPWDASTDVQTTEWNVSRDLLVRGRVRGWFENENPSGRARDDSDPLNVRPADRWVLPDDWAILAGGPADPADGSDARGTAEEFRPYYDLMIAPNNTSGLSLASPTGSGGFPQVATVATVAGFTNTSSTFAVSSAANLAVGSTIAVPAVGTSGGVGTCVTPGASSITAITPINNGAGNTVGVSISVSPSLCATPAAGAGIFLFTVPFEGPLSLIDLPGFNSGAAPSNFTPGSIRDTTFKDGDVDWWDAPMPQAPVSVKLRGSGFIKTVLKQDVYYLGTPNSASQVYPNPYYIVNVPGEPWLSAISAGGGFLWDSWGLDGAGGAGQGVYNFWQFARRDVNIAGVSDASLTNTDRAELQAIRDYYGDQSITRDAVVFSDNHGEFMVTANGDFKLDYSECATNAIAGGKHCKPGDKVGSSTITATVDYPEFRGKHPPVASNAVTVDWTWAGYKDVTIEDGETPQFKYIVFHALDRDGFCSFNTAQGTRSLHPVLSSLDDDATIGLVDPVESVDFLIDAGEGIIVDRSGGALNVDGNRQFATGIPTFSTAVNTTLKEFEFSPLAAAEQADECQAWVKVSNSLLGIVNFLVVAHDDEGDIGFDRVVDLQTTATYTLNFRWSLITWNGADNVPVTDALAGTGANDAGNDISGEVTAVYGWDQSAQDWLGYFPAGVSVPGANDLTNLRQGSAYWIAIKAPGPVTWTYATNVD